MSLWSIFWRTFAQLELAVVLAAQGMDWATDSGKWTLNADKLGAMTLGALVGGVIAVLWSWATTPASSAVQKAFRSAAQAAAAVLGGLVFNSFADVASAAAIVVPGVVGIVLAFLVTYFQNQGELPPVTGGE